jgi:predicted ribosomally synthesized peptide with SipW-like signal peptide
MQKNKILLSTLVILIVIAASLGSTMAWFTDQANVEPNVFKAGTVTLNAEDSWYDDITETVRTEGNWNPGDCTDKMIAVTYDGTKKAFLRMQIKETWELVDPAWNGIDVANKYLSPDDYFDRTAENVEWKVYVGSNPYEDIDWDTYDPKTNPNDWIPWNDDDRWHYYASITDNGEGWWYYDGDNSNATTIVDGRTINSISGVDPNSNPPVEPTTVMIVGLVCLDGPNTDNEYQGARYTINATFQAIQASHEFDTTNEPNGWEWDEVNFETGLEN